MTKPNIILINCDDLGYGDLGCYGSTVNKTPHIDQLANEGMRLTDFYMASPVCSASRAGMLTGCYPARIGFTEHQVLFPGDPWGLSAEETTIARQLKKADYATKIIGKWHCGDQPEFLPTEHGFDEYFGIPYSNDMGRQASPRDNPPLPLLRNKTVIQAQPDQRGITERYTDEALQFIQVNQEKPFFLYLAHMYVHVPLFVPKQFLDKSDNGAYGGAVECIDWSTGVIMNMLDQLGLKENTFIIFTSDNGSRARDEGGSNSPCSGTKGSTWEGGIRVPCIMRWPKEIEKGRLSSDITRSIDLLPTLSKIVGVELPKLQIDGVDLSSHIKDENVKPPNETFCYYFCNDLSAVRIGDWKLHLFRNDKDNVMLDDKFELYNLREDVAESNNLADEYPDVVNKLLEYAERIRSELGDDIKGVTGSGVRPIGKVSDDQAVPLTTYKEDYPYMIAEYDLPDMPTMYG